MLAENEVTSAVIGASIEVHRRLGPGLLESAYKECLYYQLAKNGVSAIKEKAMPLIYDEIQLECGYRIDIVVENKIVVELKSVDRLTDVHVAQTWSINKLQRDIIERRYKEIDY